MNECGFSGEQNPHVLNDLGELFGDARRIEDTCSLVPMVCGRAEKPHAEKESARVFGGRGL